MFSAPKFAKAKNSITSSTRKEINQMKLSKKFFSNLPRNAADLCNRSFDTAGALLREASDAQFIGQQGSKNLRQTRLDIRGIIVDGENPQPFASSKPTTKPEFFLMPLPRKEKRIEKAEKAQTEASTALEMAVDHSNPLTKKGRNDIILLGKVDFCIRMHKLYANLNALWSVFGKLIKIIDGKNRFEQTLLLRNTTGDGPVLKCIFYDFYDQALKEIVVGDTLRVVGRFLSENSFHVYKVEKSYLEKSTEDFSRIHNVISFVLLQKHAEENNEKSA